MSKKPFEILFFQVGAEILKNASGFIAANPNKAVQGIRKRLNKAIKRSPIIIQRAIFLLKFFISINLPIHRN